ncbi:hypothetical protein [Chitinophaga agri]|uniref:DUF4595 domain-containing protein n=1 Tax=Chitinophaga agri TaxID=2703787 RepID=A0A6B9ZC40_9BACT|nr:hypothetical protein [Chitinophaga agri]QHS59888.1 hypothetical protein GWR21_09885 [Chitinophaga agri]
MIRLLLATLTFTLLLSACSKNEGLQGEKVFSGMNNTESGYDVSYDYDKHKRVVGVTVKDLNNNPENYHSEMIRFDSTGRISFTYASEDQLSFGRIAKQMEYDTSGSMRKIRLYSYYSSLVDGYDSLGYDNAGRVIAVYHYKIDGIVAPFLLTRKDVLERDAKGNVTTRYSTPVYRNVESKDVTVTTYTYDDRPNYLGSSFSHFILNQEENAGWSSANNVLTKTIRYPKGDTIVTYTNVYTYDAANRPTARDENKKMTVAGNLTSNVNTHYQMVYKILDL